MISQFLIPHTLLINCKFLFWQIGLQMTRNVTDGIMTDCIQMSDPRSTLTRKPYTTPLECWEL